MTDLRRLPDGAGPGDPMPGGRVRLAVHAGVGWVVLDHPAKRNALSRPLLDGLAEAIDRAESDPGCRVLVVTGTGPAFCAGGDLGEFLAFLRAGDHDGLLACIEHSATTLGRLETSPLPVIAAVNGTAVAGGLEMILCCDIVLAARTARIGDGHLRYGVIPGAGGATRITQRVPRTLASRLLLTGELMSAERLREAGLVEEVLEPEDLLDRAAEIARRIATLSPLALAHVKRVAREAAGRPSAIGVKLEHEAFAAYVDSRDLREGMEAFHARRAPHFTGE